MSRALSAARHADREAEKDLAFALTKLHENNRVSAWLNTAAALVSLGNALTDGEWSKVLSFLGTSNERSEGSA